MTPLVVAAVLAAAVTHASWNAIAHGLKDQLLAFSLIELAGTLCGLTAAVFVPFPRAEAWPYLLVSVVLHLGYMALLMRSFQLGDFGQVYPLARGTAPLVVTVLAVVVVGERLDAWATAGVAVASAGLMGVALVGLRSGTARHRTPAVLAALGTGLAIAAYSVVDGAGVRASGSALGYTAWLLLLMGPAIPLYTLATRGRVLLAQMRPVWALGLLGGALSGLAYGLVLWAQTRGPLAPVAALRESSILVGATIGTVFFREQFGRFRVLAAVLMVAGISLMLHGS
ncbi:DMT family transporter [Streptomyces sp. NPDC005438]|uniref:DMT family transporter n=1 Tax=Streptomyces sp. NPDC005438 TaxID=3156880 RepID=UPI0033B95055